MAIPLPESTTTTIEALTPRQIVAELDKHVVGQGQAKRAVAIALRNRSRRQKLPPEIAEEIAPKNILMIGPTGVGKTEIARRLAKLAQSPFIKVEASKFTEVGYVGRDVESMVRDLVELAVDMVRDERRGEVREKARQAAEERVLDLLLPPLPSTPDYDGQQSSIREQAQRTREKLRDQLREGRLDHKQVEIEVREKSFPSFEIIAGSNVEEVDINMKDMLPGLFAGRTRKRRLRVPEALDALAQEEEQKLIDMETVARAAVERVQEAGIIFVDEIDKVAGREGGQGPDVSREGVQRDILPIVEGTTVNTKYGMVKTDHILFIAAGAFHVSKPSDLIPELQGRFPIRVELEALNRDDFVRILTEPKSALIKQYISLLSTEGVTLRFTDGAIGRIADFAMLVNERTENIGARRLHTVMEKLLDEISFEAPDLVRQGGDHRRRGTSIARSPRLRGTKTCRGTSCEARLAGFHPCGSGRGGNQCAGGVWQKGPAAGAAAPGPRSGDRSRRASRRQRGPLHIQGPGPERRCDAAAEPRSHRGLCRDGGAGCAGTAQQRPDLTQIPRRRRSRSVRSKKRARRHRHKPGAPTPEKKEDPRPAPGDVATFVEELNEARLKPQVVATPAPTGTGARHHGRCSGGMVADSRAAERGAGDQPRLCLTRRIEARTAGAAIAAGHRSGDGGAAAAFRRDCDSRRIQRDDFVVDSGCRRSARGAWRASRLQRLRRDRYLAVESVAAAGDDLRACRCRVRQRGMLRRPYRCDTRQSDDRESAVHAGVRHRRRHVPAGSAEGPFRGRERRRRQPDLGREHRERPRRLHRVARRSAG